MDVDTFEKARGLRAMAADLRDELDAWKRGHVGLGKLDGLRPELFRMEYFKSRVANQHWPAFAASCIADLEQRLAAVEQEFAAL